MGRKEGKNFYNKIRENPWIISTIVMLAVILFIIISPFASESSSNELISPEEAGEKIEDLLESQGAGDAEVTGTSEEKGMYRVDVSIQGQEMPIYVTKDGKSLAQAVMSFEEIEQQQQEAMQQAVDEQMQEQTNQETNGSTEVEIE
ncbi:MAG: hypothetical protein ACOC1P_05270 [Minisyncoccales bacterium]